MCSCLRYEAIQWMWGRKGKNRQPVVIQTAITNTSTLVCHPDTSGCSSTSSLDSIHSEENHLEVTLTANNPFFSTHKYLTNRKFKEMWKRIGSLKLSLLWHLFWVHTEDVRRNRGSDVFILITEFPRVKFL